MHWSCYGSLQRNQRRGFCLFICVRKMPAPQDGVDFTVRVPPMLSSCWRWTHLNKQSFYDFFFHQGNLHFLGVLELGSSTPRFCKLAVWYSCYPEAFPCREPCVGRNQRPVGVFWLSPSSACWYASHLFFQNMFPKALFVWFSWRTWRGGQAQSLSFGTTFPQRTAYTP